MKHLPIVLIISASTLLTACGGDNDNRPTLDRTVLKGYNKCIEMSIENNKGLDSYDPGYIRNIELECKSKYGIDGFAKITNFKIIN